VEGGSQAVWGGCPAVVLWIQSFDFGLQGRRQDEVLPEDEAEIAILS
jgi:hypothetical protein